MVKETLDLNRLRFYKFSELSRFYVVFKVKNSGATYYHGFECVGHTALEAIFEGLRQFEEYPGEVEAIDRVEYLGTVVEFLREVERRQFD